MLRGIADEGEEVQDLIPKLQEAFRSIDIEIMKDPNTFKSTYDLMDELAGKWDQLTDAQRAYITELVAGKRQGNIVMAMLNNWEDAQNAVNIAINSSGSAMAENEKYMDSIQAKSAVLSATWEKFWQGMIESDTIKGILDGLIKIVEMMDEANREGHFFLDIILAIMTAVTIFNHEKMTKIGEDIISFKHLGKAVKALEKALFGASVAQNTMATGSVKLRRSLFGLTAVVKGLRLAFATFLPTAVIMAISYLIQKAIEFKNETKDIDESFKGSVSNYRNNEMELKNVDKLTQEYSELSHRKLNNDEQQRFLDVQNELVSIMPELNHYYDEQGNAIISNTEQLHDLIEAKKENLELDKKSILDSYEKDGNDLQKDINKSRKNIKELEKEIADKEKKIKNYEKVGFTSYVDNLERKVSRLNKELKKEKGLLKGYTDEMREMITSVMDSDQAFQQLDVTLKTNLTNTILELGEKGPAALKQLMQTNFPKYVNNIEGAISKFSKSNRTKEDLKSLDLAFANFEKAMKEVEKEVPSLKGELYGLGLSFLQTKYPTEVARYSVKLFVNSMKHLSSNVVTAANQVSTAFRNMGINISNQTSNILKNFGNLIAGINSVADASKVIGTVLRSKKGLNMNPEHVGMAGVGWGEQGRQAIEIASALYDYGKIAEGAKNIGMPNLTTNPPPANIPASGGGGGSGGSGGGSGGSQYVTDQYAKSLAQLDKQLESSKYWQSLVTEASADYRKELTTQIELIKKKQNLAHKEAERMRSLLKTAKRGTQAYDEYENKILELQKNWTSWQSEINDLTFNRVNSQLVDFDNYLESLEHRLELSKTKMQEYKDDTDEYNNSLKEQIDLTYAIIHQLIAKQQYVRLEMQNTILNRKQQEELLKVYRQIEKELLKYRLSLLDQIKSSREKLADELINAVKKGYETQKELEEAQINHSLKLAEEAHEKKINLLDEELEKYNEMIDGILDANDRLWETDDYEKKLKEEQEERNKLAQDLMLAQSLSLSDPTRDGKIKTATEALAEQDKKIKELMQERDRKLTRQHLQDLKDKKQKEVDATKKAEDKKLELIKKETEEELKLINWKYEKLLNNDKYYDDLRTQIIEGSYNNIQNIIGRILDDLESRNAVATRKIGVSWQNVLNAIYNAQKAINSIGKNLDLEKEITDEIDNIDNSRIVAVGSYLAEKGYQVGWDYDKEMLTVNGRLMDTHGLTFELNEKGWKTHYGTPAIIDQKLKQIGMFGVVPVGEYISQKGYTVGWDYDNQLITVDGRWLSTDGFTATTNEKGWKTHYGTPELIDKKLKDIGLYHEGGIVGSNMPYESKLVDKLFNVEPNERVVKALIGEVYTPPKNILDNFMPNMKMLVNKLTPQVAIAGTGDTYNNFDVNINIDKLNGVKNSGETIAKVFTDEVKNKMKKKGIYRG